MLLSLWRLVQEASERKTDRQTEKNTQRKGVEVGWGGEEVDG